MRTDTERLDWLEKVLRGGKWNDCLPTLRPVTRVIVRHFPGWDEYDAKYIGDTKEGKYIGVRYAIDKLMDEKR